MWRFLLLGLGFVHLLAVPVSAKANETEWIQPTQSRSNLVLKSARGSAEVDNDGAGSQRIALRSDELLTTIAELRQGWAAAGQREQEDGSELVIIRRDGRGTQRLPAPPTRRHDLRLRPALVTRSGSDELGGIAWLEGSHVGALSVRTASWSQDHWDEVDIVAPPARGSQTGLVAAELEDGRWLLAWSAFDGHDDDILWSVGNGHDWTRAQRVTADDDAPDISPTLVTSDRGALLAWSRNVGGEYRVFLARFDGSGWTRARAIGPGGSLAPAFHRNGDQLYLVYEHAWPRGWVVTEMTANGRIDRSSITPAQSDGRPVLLRTPNVPAQLMFPNGRRRALDWEVVP